MQERNDNECSILQPPCNFTPGAAGSDIMVVVDLQVQRYIDSLRQDTERGLLQGKSSSLGERVHALLAETFRLKSIIGISN